MTKTEEMYQKGYQAGLLDFKKSGAAKMKDMGFDKKTLMEVLNLNEDEIQCWLK